MGVRAHLSFDDLPKDRWSRSEISNYLRFVDRCVEQLRRGAWSRAIEVRPGVDYHHGKHELDLIQICFCSVNVSEVAVPYGVEGVRRTLEHVERQVGIEEVVVRRDAVFLGPDSAQRGFAELKRVQARAADDFKQRLSPR